MRNRIKWFDLSLKLNGYSIDRARKQLDALMALPIEERQYAQDILKQKILQHHWDTNIFYRNYLKELGIDNPLHLPWAAIPIISKQQLQRPLSEVLSTGYKSDNLFRNNTSGSSGTPFHFAKDKWCHALTWANNKRLFEEHGIDFNYAHQARFYGIPKTGIKKYKEQVKDLLSNRTRFPVFDMSDSVCSNYLKMFRSKRFDYVNGYTSSLVLFAKYLLANNAILKQESSHLKACFATSEMLSEADRAIIERGFGVPCFNEYGAAELELIAFENSAKKWLLNEENLFVEIVDEQGLPLPNGQEGLLAITSLHNKAMPLIRYKIGDRGIISNERVGFNRVLQQLTGRTNDIAELPSGKKVPGLTFYYVTKALIDKKGDLKEVVVRQLSKSDFELEYVRINTLSAEEEQGIMKLLETYLEPGLNIIFKKSDAIKRTDAGKLMQFKKMF